MVNPLVRVLVLLALAWQGLVSAAVTLDITPDPAVANQSVELSFRVTGEIDGEPDFSGLEQSFEVLSRNRQTTMSWINGTSEQSTTFVLNCMPRTTGRVRIPVVSFGRQSSTARELNVGDAPAAATADNGDADIQLKVSAEPQSPYVQQQVVYTVKLLSRVDLSNPRFSQVSTNTDAVVKPLTNGRQFSESINGRAYEGYEFKYVVFPQKSGKLRIAPVNFIADVAVGRRSAFDPFARSLSTKRIESEAVELEVKPVPTTFPPGATWLPAKRLRLHEEWEPDVNSVEVGAPLTRTVFLWTDGLLSGQLPALKFEAPKGTKLYPDQAQTNDQDTANGYTSVSQQKFAIVASLAGEAHFEEVSLPWWNIETDQLEVARLPARTVTATAVAGAIAPPPVLEPAAPVTTAAASATTASNDDAALWRALAVVLALAWLITLALWRHSRQATQGATGAPASASTDPSAAPHNARATRDLKGVCAADDARGARDALLAWAHAQPAWPADLRSLRAVALRVGGELALEIERLERHLYGVDEQTWHGQALWQAFQHQPPVAPATAVGTAPLPKLFRLGAS